MRQPVYESRIVRFVGNESDGREIREIDGVPVPKDKVFPWNREFIDLQGASHWMLCGIEPVISNGRTRGGYAYFVRPTFESMDVVDTGPADE